MIEYRSEMIEPTATYLMNTALGRVGERLTAYRTGTDPIEWYQLANELVACWYMVNTVLGSLAAGAPGATHYAVAHMNESRKVAAYLKHLGGVCPITQEKKFQAREFNFANEAAT